MVMKAPTRTRPPRLWPGIILLLAMVAMGAAFYRNVQSGREQLVKNLLAKATNQQNKN